VYDPGYDMIDDKERHVNDIHKQIEDLRSLQGILFYYVDYSGFQNTRYEYYPNPHKDTNWEIPEKFKTYLEVNSNGHK